VKIADHLIPGRFIRRYHRFLTDIRLDDGTIVTAHTPNTGSMMQCAVAGHRVLISPADNPSRKLRYTLELVRVNRRWVDIHTHRANRVVEEALRNNWIPGLEGYAVRPESTFAGSRFDFLLTRGVEKALLEVKNVTLLCEKNVACFPDAVTRRGQKHLRDLVTARKRGFRSIVLFLIQRREARSFRPADRIDPEYGRLLRQAQKAGVEAMACYSMVRRPNVRLGTAIPVDLALAEP